MKGLAFFGTCFVVIMAAIVFFTFIGNVIWRLNRKQKQQRFVKRARADLRQRYPHVIDEYFTPILTLLSPCCKAMMWEYDNKFITDYFCNNCGKRYRGYYNYEEKRFTRDLTYLEFERDLSVLDKWYKDWAKNDPITYKELFRQSRP